MTAVVDEVFRASGALLAAGDELAARAGLTSARWQVLGRLADDGPMTVSELARRRGMRRQSAQEAVDRLARDGLVEKAPNAADRRAPSIRLLAAGRAALATIEPARASWAREAGGDLTVAELVQLASLLGRLRGAAVR
ncbi:MAG: MarR family transcriptional regulator [Microbacteriaceae bacterium]|nr:MarR family transcriptional regulator [Microbacteriaceae bacterium]